VKYIITALYKFVLGKEAAPFSSFELSHITLSEKTFNNNNNNNNNNNSAT
jgi:hypothetical protein